MVGKRPYISYIEGAGSPAKWRDKMNTNQAKKDYEAGKESYNNGDVYDRSKGGDWVGGWNQARVDKLNAEMLKNW